MDTIRVVVADDDREATDYLIQPLLERHADIKVVEICRTERDLIAVLDRQKPDVVLIDMSWWKNDHVGALLISEVRTHAPHLPIIAYSAHAELVSEAKADYKLTKPFLMDDMAETIRNAVHFQKHKMDSQTVIQLSDRERDTLSGIVKGKTDREIAAALGISAYTIKDHVGSILSKLHVPNRAAAAALAVKLRLVDTESG